MGRFKNKDTENPDLYWQIFWYYYTFIYFRFYIVKYCGIPFILLAAITFQKVSLKLRKLRYWEINQLITIILKVTMLLYMAENNHTLVHIRHEFERKENCFKQTKSSTENDWTSSSFFKDVRYVPQIIVLYMLQLIFNTYHR